jgi:hypothetical protein
MLNVSISSSTMTVHLMLTVICIVLGRFSVVWHISDAYMLSDVLVDLGPRVWRLHSFLRKAINKLWLLSSLGSRLLYQSYQTTLTPQAIVCINSHAFQQFTYLFLSDIVDPAFSLLSIM